MGGVPLDRTLDCPDCGAVDSVRGGVCNVCLADLDEYRPHGPDLPASPVDAGAARPA